LADVLKAVCRRLDLGLTTVYDQLVAALRDLSGLDETLDRVADHRAAAIENRC
jgi:DUF1009 family protein